MSAVFGHQVGDFPSNLVAFYGRTVFFRRKFSRNGGPNLTRNALAGQAPSVHLLAQIPRRLLPSSPVNTPYTPYVYTQTHGDERLRVKFLIAPSV